MRRGWRQTQHGFPGEEKRKTRKRRSHCKLSLPPPLPHPFWPHQACEVGYISASFHNMRDGSGHPWEGPQLPLKQSAEKGLSRRDSLPVISCPPGTEWDPPAAFENGQMLGDQRKHPPTLSALLSPRTTEDPKLSLPHQPKPHPIG